jgi:hypothetical protein
MNLMMNLKKPYEEFILLVEISKKSHYDKVLTILIPYNICKASLIKTIRLITKT